MKKLLLSIFLVGAFVACTEEPELWDSATIEYSGNWEYQLLSADASAVYVDYGHKLYTYNTAADITNEIWIDDDTDIFPMKFKASLDGTSGSFVSGRSENVYYSNDISAPETTHSIDTTTQSGDYTDFEVTEGVIVENASQMPSGVYADSIFLKVTCYLMEQEFISTLNGTDTTWNVFNTDSTISYDVDTTTHLTTVDSVSAWYDENWVKLNDTVYYQIDSTMIIEYTAKDSTIETVDSLYKWNSNGDAYEVTEEYIISGYRYTGYTEDGH